MSDTPNQNRRSVMSIETVEDRGDSRPFTLQTDRIFYMQSSEEQGSIRHDWSKYRVDLTAGTVTVLYKGGEHLTTVLTGIDAFNFLRIVKDKNTSAFAPEGHRLRN